MSPLLILKWKKLKNTFSSKNTCKANKSWNKFIQKDETKSFVSLDWLKAFDRNINVTNSSVGGGGGKVNSFQILGK